MIFLLEIMWLEEYLHVAYESNCNLKRRVEVPWVFDFLDLLDRASQHDAQLFRRSSLSSQSTSPSSIRHPFPCPRHYVPTSDDSRAFCDPTHRHFQFYFVDRGFPVGYVSFRAFSKWHWKNSRAPKGWTLWNQPRNRLPSLAE